MKPTARVVWLAALPLALAGCPLTHPANPDAGPGLTACAPCVGAADCPGGSCVQIDSDDACATGCNADTDCAQGEACTNAVSSSGAEVQVCIPTSGSCGGAGCGDCGAQICDPTTGTCVDPPSDTCGPLVGPTTAAGCNGCSGGGDCQPNGCFGGWYCNTDDNHCKPPPDTCGGTGIVEVPDAGPITGTVSVAGGTVSRLFFAVVGDTRPPDVDLTDSYPTATINSIYDDIDGLNPKPQFVLTTGDFMFAAKNGSEGAPQLNKYVAASQRFHGGPVFPTLGNHECTGYTRDNCATTTTANLRAYKAQLTDPLGLDLYYAVPFTVSDGTAKLIVAACNAWDATQTSWLEDQLATPTTYTIVARHEPSSAYTAPCINEMDQVLVGATYDLLLVGHTHTFEKRGKEIVIGNGGAPLTGSAPFGFATVELIPGTGFRVSELDASSRAVIRSFVVPH